MGCDNKRLELLLSPFVPIIGGVVLCIENIYNVSLVFPRQCRDKAAGHCYDEEDKAKLAKAKHRTFKIKRKVKRLMRINERKYIKYTYVRSGGKRLSE